MPKDCQWYAVPDSGDSQESGDFHRLGQCDPRAHWLTSMKDAGNKGWTRHLSFIKSLSLPWRTRILHSWLIPYARIEKTTDKLCMGHQPVVEIIPTGETKSSFCQCQQRSGRSYSHCTEMQVSSLPPGPTSSRRWRMTGLENPNTALPAGAGRWLVCPKEEDSGAGESYFGIHRVYMSRSRCKTYPDTS